MKLPAFTSFLLLSVVLFSIAGTARETTSWQKMDLPELSILIDVPSDFEIERDEKNVWFKAEQGQISVRLTLRQDQSIADIESALVRSSNNSPEWGLFQHTVLRINQAKVPLLVLAYVPSNEASSLQQSVYLFERGTDVLQFSYTCTRPLCKQNEIGRMAESIQFMSVDLSL